MPLTHDQSFYPLAVGDRWTYALKDGSTFTNDIIAADPTVEHQFIMVNSMQKKERRIRKQGTVYFTDSFEEGNFQVLLRDDVKPGDTWDITFKANGLDSILVMTVKEAGTTKEIDGTTYDDVIMIEAESKMVVNGQLMPLNFFTQYFYAKGVGLILTTSSAGDRMALKEYTLT